VKFTKSDLWYFVFPVLTEKRELVFVKTWRLKICSSIYFLFGSVLSKLLGNILESFKGFWVTKVEWFPSIGKLSFTIVSSKRRHAKALSYSSLDELIVLPSSTIHNYVYKEAYRWFGEEMHFIKIVEQRGKWEACCITESRRITCKEFVSVFYCL
jgi:hypothetical protein